MSSKVLTYYNTDNIDILYRNITTKKQMQNRKRGANKPGPLPATYRWEPGNSNLRGSVAGREAGDTGIWVTVEGIRGTCAKKRRNQGRAWDHKSQA